MSQLLEDFDALAADVAYRHTDGLNPASPLTLVTASADMSNFNFERDRLRIDRDLRLRSYVTWVGTTSLEMRIEASVSAPAGSGSGSGSGAETEFDLGHAHFVMVALDKRTQKPRPIHKLQPTNAREQELWDISERNRQARKRQVTRFCACLH